MCIEDGGLHVPCIGIGERRMLRRDAITAGLPKETLELEKP